MSQPDVSAAGGPSTGVISKIENAKQPSYEDRVLAQLERALRWQPGSAQQVLDGGEPRAIDGLPSLQADLQANVDTLEEEGDSPITPQLRALLEQAQRQTRLQLDELAAKVDEQNQLIRRLLDERKGA
ncbi:hypothetical protein ACIBQ1_09430 [Nonomuraea sp. NPDC050153]|uniref:hypothetical protein n=1 Tax=Nonomuraea sp. NPDC050153 TaxID=3364359 RepID=UPI0037B9BF8D